MLFHIISKPYYGFQFLFNSYPMQEDKTSHTPITLLCKYMMHYILPEGEIEKQL